MNAKEVLFTLLASVLVACLTAAPARAEQQEGDAKSILKDGPVNRVGRR